MYEYASVINGGNIKACGYLSADITVNANLMQTLADPSSTKSDLKKWVPMGKDASRPEDPVKDGYKFLDWDVSFKNVKKNLDVNAKFEKISTSSSSSSVKVSSSSSSAKASSCSSSKKRSSSSSKKDAVVAAAVAAPFNASVVGREVMVSGASVGARCDLFDAQGRPVFTGRIGSANFSVDVPQSGRYVLRIGSQVRALSVR